MHPQLGRYPASRDRRRELHPLDNLQWTVGKHSFTFGGQVAWMLYNVINDTSGTSPITLATAVTETSGINASSNTPKYVATSGTGLSYASFLIGEIDKGSFTDYLQQEFGARFRAISPYVQDTWKVNSKLTLDLGLRYDFFPTCHRSAQRRELLQSHLANPITGVNGALAVHRPRCRHLQLRHAGQQLLQEFRASRRLGLPARPQDRHPRQLRRHVYAWRRGRRPSVNASGTPGLLRGAVLLGKRSVPEHHPSHRRPTAHFPLTRASACFRTAIWHRLHHYRGLYRHAFVNRATLTPTSAAAHRSTSTGASASSINGPTR